MSEPDRLTVWAAAMRRQPLRRRDWPRVRRLGGISSALLVGSLLANDWLHMPGLAALAFVAGVAVGATMFIYAFDRRLFVTRPPPGDPRS